MEALFGISLVLIAGASVLAAFGALILMLKAELRTRDEREGRLRSEAALEFAKRDTAMYQNLWSTTNDVLNMLKSSMVVVGPKGITKEHQN